MLYSRIEKELRMKKIQMVDLVSQYHKIKPEVDRAIEGVMESAAFIKGPEVKAFAQELEEYLGVKHVIPCANGTDALQIALMTLGLEPGDEVITSDFTFAATVEVIGLLRLKPVLVDVDRDTFNINIEALEKAITPKTKAIIPVHLFGQCADMEPILAIAKKHDVAVIEDTAQAIGANYTFSGSLVSKAGTMGNLGTTSFFPSKNLGCFGDGGAIFTNDSELANRIEAIVNHGMWKRYYHDEIGVNSRLDSMQAAILRIKLRHLDEYNQARLKVANFYNDAFASIDELETPLTANNSTHVFHQYTLKTKSVDREKLQAFLNERGIPMMIYYPVPLHNQKAYKVDGVNDSQFPVTNDLCATVVSLPIHTEMEDEQLNHIVDSVKAFFNK